MKIWKMVSFLPSTEEYNWQFKTVYTTFKQTQRCVKKMEGKLNWILLLLGQLESTLEKKTPLSINHL